MELRFNLSGYEALVGADNRTIYLKGHNVKRCVQLPGTIESIVTDLLYVDFNCRVNSDLRTFKLISGFNAETKTFSLKIQKYHWYEENDIIYSHEHVIETFL